MATCGICGSCYPLFLPLQSETAQEMRLGDKILQTVRLQLLSNENVCFRCVYKVEDFSEWLNTIQSYQDRDKTKPVVGGRNIKTTDNVKRKKQFKETYVKENVWKENYTFNFTMDEELENDPSDEFIPNAQQYVSTYDQRNENEEIKFENNKYNAKPPNAFGPSKHYPGTPLKFKHPRTSDTLAGQMSSQFSFPLSEIIPHKPKGEILKDNDYNETTLQGKREHRGKFEKVPKNGAKNINDELSFSFITQLGLPEMKPEDRQGQTNKPKHVYEYSDWNLSKTSKTKVFEQSKMIGEKHVYTKCNNLHRRANNFEQGRSDDLPLNGRILDGNTSARMRVKSRFRRGQDSVDIFASQSEDCNNSRDMGSMDWQLTPDEDLIKRVRAKIQCKNDF